MPKRKFSEHVAGQKVSREELFRRALEHGQTQLFRALKTARGFERQKLGRRQKDARQKGESDEQQARLVAEVAALKVVLFFPSTLVPSAGRLKSGFSSISCLPKADAEM